MAVENLNREIAISLTIAAQQRAQVSRVMDRERYVANARNWVGEARRLRRLREEEAATAALFANPNWVGSVEHY